MQVIGLPWPAAAAAAASFVEEGKYRLMQFQELPAAAAEEEEQAQLAALLAPLQGSSSSTCEYLYVEVPGAGKQPEGAAPAAQPSRLLHCVPPGTRHPLQFGREVLCRLLAAPERIVWKDCQLGKEAEAAQAAAFRDSFAPFDFTLSL
jgi:hypothetical protein